MALQTEEKHNNVSYCTSMHISFYLHQCGCDLTKIEDNVYFLFKLDYKSNVIENYVER